MVLILLIIGSVALALALSRLRRRLQRLRVSIRKMQQEQTKAFQELMSWQSLTNGLPLRAPLMPPSEASSLNFSVEALCRVESLSTLVLGAGLLPLLCGYVVDGRVTVLEESQLRISEFEALLRVHQLQERVEIVHAPLAVQELGRGASPWYHIHSLPSFDCLVINGPNPFIGKESRYPALPALASYCRENLTVIALHPDPMELEQMLTYWQEDDFTWNEAVKWSSSRQEVVLTGVCQRKLKVPYALHADSAALL